MFSDGLYMTKPPLWSNMIELILAQTPKMKPNELIQALTPWGQATGAPGQLLPKRLPVGCLLKPMRRQSFAPCGWYQMTHSLICWAIRICLFGSNLFWVSTSVWHNLGPWATDAVPFRSSTLHKSSMAHRIALHRILKRAVGPKVNYSTHRRGIGAIEPCTGFDVRRWVPCTADWTSAIETTEWTKKRTACSSVAGRKAHQTTKTQPHRLGQNVNVVVVFFSVPLCTVWSWILWTRILPEPFQMLLCASSCLWNLSWLKDEWFFTSIISNHQILTVTVHDSAQISGQGDATRQTCPGIHCRLGVLGYCSDFRRLW